eukprot:CAMPEP_0184493260 /NCGR_PEP_ID=MMETSP0113_2-20130426/25505_1 /TAXON_ID=91329 /ORGANISM="Norrisiella sphaerica, Strain BC52" /LENGTH=278 /DNA_ID=CAMNT_0026878461 /DNA_START=49 /DNA_END=882 /DNA_ORIENTATION=+
MSAIPSIRPRNPPRARSPTSNSVLAKPGLKPAEREKVQNKNWRDAKGHTFKSLIPRFGDDSTFVPGPGQYKYEFGKGKTTSFKKYAARKFVLSTHNMQPWVPVKTPSPATANYDRSRGLRVVERRSPSPVLPKGDRWEFKRILEREILEGPPGPGHYSVPTTPIKSTNMKFSQLPRFTAANNKNAVKIKAEKVPGSKKFPSCKVRPRKSCLLYAGKKTLEMQEHFPDTITNNKSPAAIASFKSSIERNPYKKMEHVFMKNVPKKKIIRVEQKKQDQKW